MSSSRDMILAKLRTAQKAFTPSEQPAEHVPMVPLADRSPQALLNTFVERAEKLGVAVYQPASSQDAFAILNTIIGTDQTVLAWDFEHIPLPDLEPFLKESRQVADPRDGAVRVGITGADAGLAAIGSLVLSAGVGRHRVTSLLPSVHIAILRQSDIVPDLESWMMLQQERGLAMFRQAASVMVISGPSRTGDIAMQLILGMHGPEELHILLV